MTLDVDRLRREAKALGPWFHNLHLPGGVQTNPEHPLGDFPMFKWKAISAHIPADLTGKRVLDIGCNAGFYSLQFAARGAEVIAIDSDFGYLRQARWAAEIESADIHFEQRSVYELSDLNGPFDIVLFMGVLYHLRHPLLALDLVRSIAPKLLVFQTLTYGPSNTDTSQRGDVDFGTREALLDSAWPRLAFIETTFAGDPTNWWIANEAAAEALLRAAGFVVIERPAHEIYFCKPHTKHSPDRLVQEEIAAAAEAVRCVDL